MVGRTLAHCPQRRGVRRSPPPRSPSRRGGVGVRTRRGRRSRDLRHRPAEPRRGPGLHQAVELDEHPRAALCGWRGASSGSSTGATHASLPAKRSHHSSRVLVRTTAATRSFIAGHDHAVVVVGQRAASVDVVGQPRGRADLGLPRVDRTEREIAHVRRLVHLVEPRPCRGGSLPPLAPLPGGAQAVRGMPPSSAAAPSTIAASITWPPPAATTRAGRTPSRTRASCRRRRSRRQN